MNSLKSIILILFFLLTFNQIFTLEFTSKEFGYSLDLVEEWDILDNSNPAVISFSSPEGNSVFQIFTFNGNAFKNATEIYSFIADKLKATGENEPFIFCDSDSIFADLTYSTGKMNLRGYFALINRNDYDFAILSFTIAANFEKNNDILLSNLDSFSLNNESKYLPGIVSQYYYPYTNEKKTPITFKIDNIPIKTQIDENELEATQILIEREARILGSYTKKENRFKAWLRFYKMIYKDNFTRFVNISSIIKTQLKLNEKKEEEIVKILLRWIQDMKYEKAGTFSDFNSPLLTLANLSGDCDSKAILFLILLDYYNINSIMLVSEVYKHSALGINIAGEGAKLQFEDKDYLYTELTEKVEIGMIPQKMSLLSNWIIMKLGN